ncbi:MAG: isochorismatase hydrolase [Frankiales bacterium]|nr:isochorismatase hydrolase [Frankiales bacterium]
MTRALLVVDVQVDFCEDGSLPVAGGKQVAADVRTLLSTDHGYDLVVASEDWHVDPGSHFAERPDFATSWPAHCVVGTGGARLQEPLTEDLFDAVVRKGEHAAAYSAFEGATEGRTLAEVLQGVTALDVCGVATDHCVRASVLDACAAGLEVRVLLPLCAGVAPATTEAALAEMSRAGARVLR